MNTPTQSPETNQTEVVATETPESKSGESMQDYYQLQQNLLITTLILTGVIFVCVWLIYSLNIACSYLLGACVGAVYLKLLGRDVARLGTETKISSASRLAMFAGLIIVASRWQQLHIVPVFLGFLTYKAAIIAYMLPSAIFPQK